MTAYKKLLIDKKKESIVYFHDEDKNEDYVSDIHWTVYLAYRLDQPKMVHMFNTLKERNKAIEKLNYIF